MEMSVVNKLDSNGKVSGRDSDKIWNLLDDDVSFPVVVLSKSSLNNNMNEVPVFRDFILQSFPANIQLSA